MKNEFKLIKYRTIFIRISQLYCFLKKHAWKYSEKSVTQKLFIKINDMNWRKMTDYDFFDKWISDVIIGATIDWHVRKHYVLDYKGGVNYVQ